VATILHDLDVYTGGASCGEMRRPGKRIYFTRRLEDVNCPACLEWLHSPQTKLEDVHRGVLRK